MKRHWWVVQFEPGQLSFCDDGPYRTKADAEQMALIFKQADQAEHMRVTGNYRDGYTVHNGDESWRMCVESCDCGGRECGPYVD